MYVDMKTSVTALCNGQPQMLSVMLNTSLRMIKIKSNELLLILEHLFPSNNRELTQEESIHCKHTHISNTLKKKYYWNKKTKSLITVSFLQTPKYALGRFRNKCFNCILNGLLLNAASFHFLIVIKKYMCNDTNQYCSTLVPFNIIKLLITTQINLLCNR